MRHERHKKHTGENIHLNLKSMSHWSTQETDQGLAPLHPPAFMPTRVSLRGMHPKPQASSHQGHRNPSQPQFP